VRVAIDASFLSMPPSGTGVYLAALLRELPNLDPELELIEIASEPAREPVAGAALPKRIVGKIAADPRVRRGAWELGGSSIAARNAKPDVLHIPSFAAPIVPPCPLVVTVHDVIPLMLPEYRASAAMRVHLAALSRTIGWASLVLTPSEAAARDIAALLPVPRALIRVTPEAAGPDFKPVPDPVAAKERVRHLGITGRYIFNIGGLDARKNLSVLLEAFAILRARLDEPVQLVIAGAAHTGNPSVFPPLTPHIRRLNLESAVVLPGRVSDADKIALHQAADLYVTPSLAEGFGLTALEAMASGAPAIVANRTSLPEVIGDGGLHVEPRAANLASLMQLILTNPAVAADLRERGLARAAEFSWRKTAELTLAAYREASQLPRQLTPRRMSKGR
jgi:glycosyltransferase involved in cell wall biosynthesis